MNPVIEFKDVSFSYNRGDNGGGRVEDLSFEIFPGDFVAIIGSNGAGKTTTSKLMNGLLRPKKGEVRIGGVATNKCATSKIAHKVGMLFQDPDKQICKGTVREELAFSLSLHNVSKEEIVRRVEKALKDFDFPGDAAPFMLSRGERQLLALASVVVCEPDILILDEPTTGLDFRECMSIMKRIEQLNAKGTTVVMISHDMEVVGDFAKRVIVMAKGNIIADGKPAALFRNTSIMEQASLLAPMIVELSCLLSQEPHFHNYVTSASTVGEMLKAIETITHLKRKAS